MSLHKDSFGTTRHRPASVSFAEIENAARALMAAGEYPSVAAVRKALTRGSSTTINEAMQRFWKNQAALSTGNPIALTRLPPEFADAAVGLWEQALRLSLQTAQSADNAAKQKLEDLKRDTESRARSVELREKEWDLAARIRERALSDARDQINLLLGELAKDRGELRSRSARVTDLEAQVEEYRSQISTLITRAVEKSRAARVAKTSSAKKQKKSSRRKAARSQKAKSSNSRKRRARSNPRQ